MTSVLLIGASAGGIDPLTRLIEQLPADLDAPVLVVVHTPADAESRLPEILQRRCKLRVAHAIDAEPILPGRVYVARPDHHLTVETGVTRVLRGPRQNRHRPAIDPLFRSASRWAGRGAIGVVLSGAAGDGVAGALVVARRSGRVLVQDPAEALFPGMPERVLQEVPEAVSMALDEMPEAIVRSIEEQATVPLATGRGQERATMDDIPMAPVDPGRPAYSCPDCGGVLEEIVEGGPLRFQCRVGHAFYADDLAMAQWETLEDALWSAIRGMEESAELSSRLARIAETQGASKTARRHRERGRDVLAQSRIIRDFLLTPQVATEVDEMADPTRRAAAAR